MEGFFSDVSENTPSVYWKATLDDGDIIVDGSVTGERSTWFKLKERLQQRPRKITAMEICFRDTNTFKISIEQNRPAYFCIRKAIITSLELKTHDLLGIGYLGSDNLVHVVWAEAPTRIHEQVRTKESSETGLIYNG